MMKLGCIVLVLAVVVAVSAGCGRGEATPTPAVAGGMETYTSAVLGTSHAGALPAGTQLALGTFRLEETENGVTSEQAKVLLPLWQAIQGGALQGRAEVNAVLQQIEGEMTGGQLEAIIAMQLTWQDLQNWAQDQGLSLGPSSEALATRQAEGGQQPGGFGQFSDMSEEERANLRATAEAGGFAGFGQRGNKSAGDREALRATAEASGLMPSGGRGFGSGWDRSTMMLEPLIELLTQRAAG